MYKTEVGKDRGMTGNGVEIRQEVVGGVRSIKQGSIFIMNG